MAEKPIKRKKEISSLVIKRLPRYYRFIGELIKQGAVRSSSNELANKMSLTASQIRQDLNCFGGFGQQGYGYNLLELRQEIGKILGVDRNHKAILIGVGNLGKAIAYHMDFQKYGCSLIGAFDNDPEKFTAVNDDLKIHSIDELEEFCTEHKPDIAILCIPKKFVQETADKLIQYNIKAFWNFSPCEIALPKENICVENMHLGDSLMTISYRLTSYGKDKNNTENLD